MYTQSNRSAANGPALFMSLAGDLGTGKTTATRHLLKAMGYAGKVKSPTYSLCEEYHLNLSHHKRLAIFHFDLYRMQSPDEWVEAGLREPFSHPQGPTLCIVEWPEKAEATLPTMDLAITLSHLVDDETQHGRRVQFEAHSDAGERIVDALVKASP